MLYNGGTLSNRLENSTQVIAKKTWEAAAYQAAFKDVAVELTLQSRLEDGTADWADVKNDDGSKFTRYLYNFTDDRLTETYSLSMPRYDAQGRELEYQWVETAVYQNVKGSTDAEVRKEIENCTATKREIAQDGTFTLKQGASDATEDVTYVSEIEEDGTIVNSIRDTINYQVIKKWQNPNQQGSVTINIYQVPSGSANFFPSDPYVSFSYDNTGKLIEPTQEHLPAGITVTQDQENGENVAWHATVNNLPRFDKNGRPYEYVLLEQTGYPTYTTKREADGDYITTVLNGSGTEAIPILVHKVWLDDGDDLHREPVTFTVYNRHTDTVIKEVTLGDDDKPGLWHEVIQIPKANGVTSVDDLYVVETLVGEHAVDYRLTSATGKDKYQALYETGKGDNDQVFDVTTSNHRYQVTYEYKKNETANNDPGGVKGTFTITNRRLGHIDLTVTKNWVDGDHDKMVSAIKAELETIAETKGKKLALVFQLQFADESKNNNLEDGWEITYTGFDSKADTVQVGGLQGEKVPIYSGYASDGLTYGQTASSEQVIIGYGTDTDGSIGVVTADEACFFGLPKYDANGKSVEYTVKELWLDVTDVGQTPTPVTDMKNEYPGLWALWKDYQISYGTPVIEGDSTHTKDEQSLEVTNSRSRTKNVTWTKIWKDDFTYNSSLRPDIYLDIYAVSHTSETEQRITQVQKDVK